CTYVIRQILFAPTKKKTTFAQTRCNCQRNQFKREDLQINKKLTLESMQLPIHIKPRPKLRIGRNNSSIFRTHRIVQVSAELSNEKKNLKTFLSKILQLAAFVLLPIQH